ncbi:MAG: type VI secretion system protein TssA [Chitinivibrionales bacterium]|nr:type VI secretion system protein TssA [Chitinivibrionales bacterium]
MGENVNYDTDFDALKSEIGKLGGIDYELIINNSRKILAEKSKDLRVMAFLSFALLRDEQWEAFADLFEGMTSLTEQDYDNCFPARPRAKGLAIKWISEERYTEFCNQKKPTESDYEHITRLVESLTKLKSILESKFPDGSPFPSNLFKKAQSWEKACKPKPKAEQSQQQPAQNQAQAYETPKQAQTEGKKLARFLIEKEPVKIMGYRLMRSLRWDLMENAPPASDGKTQLQGPNAQQKAFLEGLIGQKDWKTLFEKSEETFTGAGNHLWLDLQRYSATACKELGESNAAIRDIILIETAVLLKRIPTLVELAFTDGTPFCDDTTKSWIKSEVMSALSGGKGGDNDGDEDDDEDILEKEKREAQSLAATGKVDKALELLQNGIRSSSCEEDNFNRSILMGQLLLKGKQPDIAVSILEALDEKIDTYHLHLWNPDLAVEAWAVLVQALKVGRANKPQNQQVEMTTKLNDTVKKISQINPTKAFTLNK